MRRTLALLLTAAAMAASILGLSAPAVTHAAEPTVNAVVEWNRNATDAFIGVAGQPPQQAFPHLAMVQGAVYDAVNAIAGGREGYLITKRLGAPGDSKEAAVAAAAYRVIVSIVPAQQGVVAAKYNAFLTTIEDGPTKAGGIAVGEAAAAAMIADRSDDGRFGDFRFSTGTAPGAWRPVLPGFASDPSAWLKDVKPFLLASPAQLRTTGPLPLTSSRYAREFDEVKTLGSAASTVRTDEQTRAAQYWGAAPHATWSRIARTIAVQEEVPLVGSARLFAEVHMSVADALIVVWNDKEHSSFWRPITAIREANADGNRATVADPEWLPLITTPPYPEHPSGLTAVASATLDTLKDFFHRETIGWTDTNPAGITRSFTRLSQAEAEVIDARIWSGVHFRTADEQGARIGSQVASWRAKHYFGRVHGR